METMAQAAHDEQAVEVTEKAKRRQYSAAYKLRILKEADACTKAGEVGALLRREGLYSSHLTAWRKARAKGERRGLEAKPRGDHKSDNPASVTLCVTSPTPVLPRRGSARPTATSYHRSTNT